MGSLYQRLTTPTSTTSITAIVTTNTMRAAIVCAIFLAIIVTVIEGESGRRREMVRGRRGGLRPRERKVVRRKVGAEKTSRGETGRRGRKQMRRGRKLERVQQGRQGIVVKGNDCEFIYLADITSNSGCSNGQKFVLKGANNTRKQFLIVNDKAIIAFITKRKKFTACESFTDITTSVSCKTVSGLDNVTLPSSSSSNSSSNSTAATTTAPSNATTAAPAASNTTAAATTAASNATTASNSSATTAEADDEVVTRVKGYIDAGTCGSISSSSSCGASATSYFKEITYNGKRVLISNQVPDHDHENDQLSLNPNEACERYQFIELPLNPAKGSSATRTGLGTIGLAVTGGAFFNDWSSPNGDIALYNEGSSLDSCFGHSASGGGCDHYDHR